MPIKRLMYFAGLLLSLGLVALSLEVGEAQGPAFPYDEAEAQAIDRMLMCPVCPGENIDQSQVELARQMRLRVREMLAQGASRDEILSFFVERYGTDVLAAPPKSGVNLVAWVFPPVGVLLALGAGFLVIRSMTGRRAAAPATDPQFEDDLGPYLQIVDRDLALSEGQAEEQAEGQREEGIARAPGRAGLTGPTGPNSTPPGGPARKPGNTSTPDSTGVDTGREGGPRTDG